MWTGAEESASLGAVRGGDVATVFARDGAPFRHRTQWYDFILFLTEIIQIFCNFMKINKKTQNCQKIANFGQLL